MQIQIQQYFGEGKSKERERVRERERETERETERERERERNLPPAVLCTLVSREFLGILCFYEDSSPPFLL